MLKKLNVFEEGAFKKWYVGIFIFYSIGLIFFLPKAYNSTERTITIIGILFYISAVLLCYFRGAEWGGSNIIGFFMVVGAGVNYSKSLPSIDRYVFGLFVPLYPLAVLLITYLAGILLIIMKRVRYKIKTEKDYEKRKIIIIKGLEKFKNEGYDTSEIEDLL